MLLYWDFATYPRGWVGVPYPPLFAVVAPSCAFFGHVGRTICLLVLSCISLCRISPSALMCLRDWGGVRASLGLEISWRAYLKSLILAPSSHCRRWRLIFYGGTLYSRMHWCVARTKVMATLLLTYPQVLW